MKMKVVDDRVISVSVPGGLGLRVYWTNQGESAWVCEPWHGVDWNMATVPLVVVDLSKKIRPQLRDAVADGKLRWYLKEGPDELIDKLARAISVLKWNNKEV